MVARFLFLQVYYFQKVDGKRVLVEHGFKEHGMVGLYRTEFDTETLNNIVTILEVDAF